MWASWVKILNMGTEGDQKSPFLQFFMVIHLVEAQITQKSYVGFVIFRNGIVGFVGQDS